MLTRAEPSTNFPSKPPPKSRVIPEQYFKSPKVLFDKTYSIQRILGPILTRTNFNMRKKFPLDDIFSMEEFQRGFGMLLYASLEKSKNKGMDQFWAEAVKFHKNLEQFKLLSLSRFKKFRSCLDVGVEEYVLYPGNEHRHINSQKKIWPFVQLLNSTSANFCSFDWGRRFMSLDESLRRSFGHRDPMRKYNPSKPAKYGHQVQMLSGPDGHILSVIPDLDSEHKLYQNLGELFSKILPSRCKGLGLFLAMDNFFLSREGVEYLVARDELYRNIIFVHPR